MTGYTAANRRSIRLMVEQAAPLFEGGSVPMFMVMADALSKVAIEKPFYAISPETDPFPGRRRLYVRTEAEPGYEALSLTSQPVSQSDVDDAIAPLHDIAFPAWSDPLAASHLDWAKDRHWQVQPARQFRSFSRLLDYGGSASVRATAAALENGNNVAIIAANTVRRSEAGAQIERASSNLLPYHDWVGAVVGVIGSGGALPTGWEPNFPVVREIVGSGIENGRRWISFKLSRTGGAPVAANINVRTLNAAKMTAPGPIVASGQIQVVSMSGVATGVQVNINEFQADGATAVGTTSGRLYTPADGRQTYATWRNTGATNKVTQNFNVACSSTGGDFEVVFKIWSPQIEAGEDAEDFTSTMSAADGTSPRAADAVGLLVADGLYDVLTRGDNYDAWNDLVEAVDERLPLPTSRRNRKILAHRAYHSERITPAQKQEISDERAPLLATIGDANQTIDGSTYWVQTAAQPWSFLRASNKREYYEIQCRKGFPWAGDAAGDRIRTEFQHPFKESFGVDVWRFNRIRYETPTGILAPIVLAQWHATEDAGDFAGYPNYEESLRPDQTLSIYTSSVAAAAQPIAYPRTLRAEGIPFAAGVWHTVLRRVRFGWNGNAILQVWIDGNLVVDEAGISIGHNDAIGPYWKQGLYWSDATADQTVISHIACIRRSSASLLDFALSPPIAY